jgi:hypothetical protein
MSTALEAMIGIRVSEAAALNFLGALERACNSKQPIGRQAIVVSPEHAYLTLRAELVDQYHGMGMHSLASQIARYSARGSEVLVVVVGDERPALNTIPLARLRTAFAMAAARAAIRRNGGT